MTKNEKELIVYRCLDMIKETPLEYITYNKSGKESAFNTENRIIDLTATYDLDNDKIVSGYSNERLTIILNKPHGYYILNVAMGKVELFNMKISKKLAKILIGEVDSKYENMKIELISKVFTSYDRDKKINETLK